MTAWRLLVQLVFPLALIVTLASAAPPQLVKDVNPSTAASHSYPGLFHEVGGTTLFTANDVTHGSELWKTDGTAATP